MDNLNEIRMKYDFEDPNYIRIFGDKFIENNIKIHLN